MSKAFAAPAKSEEKSQKSPAATGVGTSTVKEKLESNNGIAAAIARSLTRGVAIYFSRPVRLFRPAKVSGWTSLRGSANRTGQHFTPQYVLELIRSQGFLIIPRHFIPPIFVNTLLGVVLWESYGISSSHLETLLPNHPIAVAATSGAIAGGCQSIAAAPAENVRIVLESTKKVDAVKAVLGKPGHVPDTHSGWMHAWKQVFVGDQPLAHATTREEVKELRRWASEIKGLAGRGWDGWTWGCAKDMIGFALFFSIFELSRKVATDVASLSVNELEALRGMLPNAKPPSDKTRNTTSRVAQGVTLVSGGVVAGLGYEIVCRPFDNARRLVYLDDVHRRAAPASPSDTGSPRGGSGSGGGAPRPEPETRSRVVTKVIVQKLKNDGVLYFFSNPQQVTHVPDAAVSRATRGMYAALRTLGRVGPWGVGFLLYESLGGNLTPQL